MAYIEDITIFPAIYYNFAVCSHQLLKFGNLYWKQYEPRSDCSFRSSLIGLILFASMIKSSLSSIWICKADIFRTNIHWQVKAYFSLEKPNKFGTERSLLVLILSKWIPTFSAFVHLSGCKDSWSFEVDPGKLMVKAEAIKRENTRRLDSFHLWKYHS